MRSMQCNVQFGYQLSICSRSEENHGKTLSSSKKWSVDKLLLVLASTVKSPGYPCLAVGPPLRKGVRKSLFIARTI
jgi:hypothetical protein